MKKLPDKEVEVDDAENEPVAEIADGADAAAADNGPRLLMYSFIVRSSRHLCLARYMLSQIHLSVCLSHGWISQNG